MAWEKVVANKAKKIGLDAASVVMSVAPANERRGRRLVISVNAEQTGASWWRHDASVEVMHGTGAHTGKLRIEMELSGTFKLVRMNKKSGRELVRLKIPAPQWLGPEGRVTRKLSFSVGPTWLEIEMPRWARRDAEVAKITDMSADEIDAADNIQDAEPKIAEPAKRPRISEAAA